MNKAFLAASVLGLLSTGVAATAVAGGPEVGPNQVAVYYNDLNLQSASGQRTLKYRLTKAARSVCPDELSRDLVSKNAGKRCVRQAVGDALNTVSEQQVAKAEAIKVKGDRG